ncbi:MAG: acyl-CoA dehydrogenase family protein, partial [Myxococcota bacterium]|nr:acyl-CoA dehydrogenase family protein [Myxococcota bacterium]
MNNYYRDNDDLQWYVNHGIDWEPIVELTEYLYRSQDGHADCADALSFYRDIFELVGEFTAEEIGAHSEEIDRQGVELIDGEGSLGPRQDAIFKKIKRLELHGMPIPRELGGMNCPMLVYYLNTELFSRADASVAAHHGFHAGIAMAMLVYSIQEGTTEYDPKNARIKSTRFQKEIDEIRRGVAWGCMDITEPNAGSDMAALSCRGEQDDDGNWFVTGSKIYITSGHGKYHFVIARTEDAANPEDPFAGLGGLSMFLVPAYTGTGKNKKRIVEIVRLEEKLGHHGSATAALSFDRAPAQLVGERG